MDIKITLDISDRMDAALGRLADVIQAVTIQTAPVPIIEPITCATVTATPEEASDLPVETPDPSPVSKPVEPPKSESDVKIESPAATIDEAPASETKDETPVEAPKPKRSHHKKTEKPAEPEPQPEPEKPAEPEMVKSATPENEAKTDAPEMSLDEVRAVCVQAAKAGKTKVVTDFLGAHDAQSLSKLDPKHYAELAEIVKAAL